MAFGKEKGMKKRYYLAYGSNLNMEQMQWRCPAAEAVGTAMMEGYELLFKGSKTGAYLTIGRKDGSGVPVGVWAVTERDEAALDRYEGFPAFYRKEELELPVKSLTTGKTEEKDAFVYIMDEERDFGIPSEFYVQVCLEGYADFGFDEAFLKEAFEKSKKEVLCRAK